MFRRRAIVPTDKTKPKKLPRIQNLVKHEPDKKHQAKPRGVTVLPRKKIQLADLPLPLQALIFSYGFFHELTLVARISRKHRDQVALAPLLNNAWKHLFELHFSSELHFSAEFLLEDKQIHFQEKFKDFFLQINRFVYYVQEGDLQRLQCLSFFLFTADLHDQVNLHWLSKLHDHQHILDHFYLKAKQTISQESRLHSRIARSLVYACWFNQLSRIDRLIAYARRKNILEKVAKYGKKH